MSHVVLLGDSIFDNLAYIPPGQPPVIKQVLQRLPSGWTASLVAVDGHTVEDVATQLPRIPAEASHLVLSVGGNDALGARGVLEQQAETVGDALATLGRAVSEFRNGYISMLASLLERRLPTCVCTIYDAIPLLGDAERAALAGFNDVIIRAAIAEGIPLIDLRLVCTSPDDYSPVSPIEPSVQGGSKIAGAICRMVAGHGFTSRRMTAWM